MPPTLTRMIWQTSASAFTSCVVASLIYAIATLYLAATISARLGNPSANGIGWSLYLLIAVCAVAAHAAMSLSVNYVLLKVARKLRLGIVRSIDLALLEAIEGAGTSRVFATLQEDTARVANALPAMVTVLRDTLFVLACTSYLALLSLPMGAVVAVAFTTGAIIYHLLQHRGVLSARLMAEQSEQSVGVFRHYLDGIKQLKLDVQRRESAYRITQQIQEAMGRNGEQTSVYFSAATAASILMLFVLLGLAGYGGLGTFSWSAHTNTFALLVLLMFSPVLGIASAAQPIAQARIALNRIVRLSQTLAPEDPAGTLTGTVSFTASASFGTLALHGITHTYPSENTSMFSLGPIDLAVSPGESLFIVGGNGAGKTTLGKLLSGLYIPHSGVIHLAGHAICDSNRHWYRNNVAAMFADFCLFEAFAEADNTWCEDEDRELIEKLRLGHLVEPGGNLLSRARSFSSGERKRAGLYLAYRADRPIYLFDEFAADQDPNCKDLFYHEVIPDLKRRGKIVIVITHDSRYFGQADVTLTLVRGMTPLLQRTALQSSTDDARGRTRLSL